MGALALVRKRVAGLQESNDELGGRDQHGLAMRLHTGVGGHPPISRWTELPGQYSQRRESESA
jgi:hypothetical protein